MISVALRTQVGYCDVMKVRLRGEMGLCGENAWSVEALANGSPFGLGKKGCEELVAVLDRKATGGAWGRRRARGCGLSRRMSQRIEPTRLSACLSLQDTFDRAVNGLALPAPTYTPYGLLLLLLSSSNGSGSTE